MASTPDRDAVLNALRVVIDPDIRKDIVSLGFVKDLTVSGARVSFTIELTTPACPVKDQLRDQAAAAVRAVPGVADVEVQLTAKVRSASAPEAGRPPLPGVKNVIAVGAGKGGVGKTTVTVNLAVALAQMGARVGLMDADIYGPNVPLMMGTMERPQAVDNRIQPVSHYGVNIMSMGFLMSDDTAVIWRGPMLHSAVRQFIRDVDWGELDYLLVDLPPGTGDVQLTLTQTVPLMGAVVVSTPQDVALQDARKAIKMFRQVKVDILGIVENMSYFQCPHCNQRTNIFSHGGGETTASRYQTPFLGEIPLDVAIREGGDAGKPIVIYDSEAPAARAFSQIAGRVAAQVSMSNLSVLSGGIRPQ